MRTYRHIERLPSHENERGHEARNARYEHYMLIGSRRRSYPLQKNKKPSGSHDPNRRDDRHSNIRDLRPRNTSPGNATHAR